MMNVLRGSFRIASVVAACSFAAVQGAISPPRVEAGVARVNLTPPLEMKAALGGYGERLSKPAVGVHDAVWAKALVLSQGDRRFALVTADVLAFPPGFKAAVLERLKPEDWTSDQVMLLPSHTHTSIDMMALHPRNLFALAPVGVFHKELFELTANRVAQVIRDAGQAHASIRADSRTVPVPDRNRNRRPRGATHDPDLTVTRIDTSAGRPLAVLVNWTAHPTFMDPSDMLFSGDWPGHLQRTLEALIGPPVTVMFYNGAEGDQSPTPPPDCGSNWERAERYGRDLGLTAWRTWEKLRPAEVAEFAFATVSIGLPKRQWHPDFMKTGGAEYGLNEAMMPRFVEQLVPLETWSTALRLGDLVIAGVPGELAAALGLEGKARVRQLTGAPCATIGGLADEWVSYILPAEQYRLGGYEASMCFYGETLGTTILEGVAQAAQALRP
jgi:hypothetical protein